MTPAARAAAPLPRLRRLRLPRLSRPSLVRRLVLLAAAWSLGVLVLAGLTLSLFFGQSAIARFDSQLSESIDGLLAGTTADGGQLAGPANVDQRSLRAFSGEYWEIVATGTANGDQMVRSRSLWDRALPEPPGGFGALARSPGEVVFYDAAGPLKQPLRVAAMQGRLPDLPVPIVFMAARDRTPVNRDVRNFDTTIATALLLLGGGLIAAVIIQVRVGLEPLFALRREVAALRTGQSERVVGTYPSELEPLAVELNALMAHTQAVVERQRTHVGNLAHALKTPLSVLLTESRQQPGPLADVVERQAQSMSQHVDHHLRRARAAARAQGQGERTPVAPLLEDLSRTLEKIFQDKLDEIEWECPETLQFLGERQDLLEIAGNVMENACKWCAHRVRVRAEAAGPRTLTLTIEDDGPGLAPEQRAEVLRRGARLDEHTPGSGLGLSIVDELSRAYGGSVALGASDWGGLALTVTLPRAES